MKPRVSFAEVVRTLAAASIAAVGAVVLAAPVTTASPAAAGAARSAAAGGCLASGAALTAGHDLVNGSLELEAEANGTFALVDSATGTPYTVYEVGGLVGDELIMQSDGDLALSWGGSVFWSTGTAGNPGAEACIADGGLVVTTAANIADPYGALWHSSAWGFRNDGEESLFPGWNYQPGDQLIGYEGKCETVIVGNGLEMTCTSGFTEGPWAMCGTGVTVSDVAIRLGGAFVATCGTSQTRRLPYTPVIGAYLHMQPCFFRAQNGGVQVSVFAPDGTPLYSFATCRH